MLANKVEDPYKVLGVGHDASAAEIKLSYRRLAKELHPDRLARKGCSPEDIARASGEFSKISVAYSLLSDSEKKAQYDHIYKYGGFDDDDDPDIQRQGFKRAASPSSFEDRTPRTTRHKGIGYSVFDPIAFVMSSGRVRSKTVAGIHIPSRMNFAGSPRTSFRVAVSTGEIRQSSSGTLQCVSRTTKFENGKRLSKTETTTFHNDGRKEIIIEGDDYIERRFSREPVARGGKGRYVSFKDEGGLSRQSKDLPWYMSAWRGIRDNARMCYGPCFGEIRV